MAPAIVPPKRALSVSSNAAIGVVPKSIWNKSNPADQNNMCSWALRCLLIEDGNRLILIDNGMGNKQDEKFFGYYYLHGNDTLQKSLNKYGFEKKSASFIQQTLSKIIERSKNVR